MLYFFLMLFGFLGLWYIAHTQKPWHSAYMRSLPWWIYMLYAIFLGFLLYRFGFTHMTIFLIVVVSRAMFFFDKRFLLLFALLYIVGSIFTSSGSILLLFSLYYFLCAVLLFVGEYMYKIYTR